MQEKRFNLNQKQTNCDIEKESFEICFALQ